MNAPPTPWAMRPRMSDAESGASAQPTEATVKMATPSRNIRARPYRSASLPALSTSTVVTTV